MSSLKSQAIRGVVWSVLGYGTSQVLRLGSNLILTRLLVPEFFGLMTLMSILIIGLQLFSDIGVGPSIIQNQRGDDPDFFNTAWTIQVIRGGVLWLGAITLAWPVALFYGDRQFLWLVPIVGFSTILTGLESTNRFLLQRHLSVRNLAFFEIGGQLITSVCIVIWALASPTIWALVGGSLISAVIQMIWSHFLVPNTINRLHWDSAAAKEIFSFGRWIFLSTAATFLAAQSDRIILGKLVSLQLLGVYGIAFTLANVPEQVIQAISAKVIFPAMSKFATMPRPDFRVKILKNRSLLILSLAVSLATVVGFGDFLVEFLYDQRYQQGAWMLPLLALGTWPIMLIQTSSPALFAIGEPRYSAYGHFSKFICLLIGLPLGFWAFENSYSAGIVGFILVMTLGNIPFYLSISYGLQREQLNCAQQDLKITLFFMSVLAAICALRLMLGLGTPIDTLLISFPTGSLENL
jgi:O-antigen/teichoic acid export membrane protein